MPDYTVGDTVYKRFTTRAFATGIPGTLGGVPVVSAYEDDSVTQITAGITLGADHDSVTGLNLLTIVATGANGYEAGKSYDLVITTGTVDSVSVVGEVVWHFTLSAEAAAVDLANSTDGLGVIKTDTSAIIDLVNGLGGATGGSVSIETVLDNTVTDTTDAAAAVDKGTSPETVGVPVTGHSFVAGQQVTLAGTTNYNGSFDVDSVSTNEVVIIATFNAETFGGSDTIISTVKTIPFVGSVQAGSITSTEALDGIIHDIDDVGNDIDLVYTFSVGAGRTGTAIIFHGFVQSNGDTLDIEVYDHIGADWEVVRTITGQNGTSNITQEVPLLLKHTGASGLDTGRVYVRLDTNATTPSNLSVDQLLVEAINTGALNAYENGRIWLNTNASNINVVADVDGTTRRPVSTIAALKTLSTSTGLSDFHVINGSSVTLAESTTNESYFGDNWSLALGGQDVDGAYFQGALVTGVGTAATEVHFEGCGVGTMSIQNGHFDFCSFDGTVTHTLAGDYNYHNCYSKVAGVGAPIFTKTAGQVVTVQFRNWSGSITMSGIEASDVMTISGTELGDVVLNGADGTVKILGIYESLTDNRTGSPTLVEGAFEGSDVTDILVDTAEIGTAGAGLTDLGGMSTAMKAEVNAEADTALTDYDGPTNAEMEARTLVAAAYFDPVVDAVASVTLVDTTTTNTDMRGTDNAALASVATEARLAELDAANLPANIDAILIDTAEIGAAGAGLTAVVWNAAWDAEVQSEVNDGLVAFFTSSAQLVDDVWDEAITTSVHNGANSAGKRLRQTSSSLAAEGAVSDVGATATDFDTDLAEASNDHYNDQSIYFLTGNLAGQARVITTYTGATKNIMVDEAFTEAPANGDEFAIQNEHVHPVSQVADAVWDEAVAEHVAAGSFGATDAAVLVDTSTTLQGELDAIQAAVITNASGADIAADIIAMKAETALIVADTNELQVDDVPGLIAALNDVAVADILTTQMTEAYAADGAAPTIAQALMMIQQTLQEFAISGTTLTVKKVDGSTTAATLTLDDGTTPTSLTRAT